MDREARREAAAGGGLFGTLVASRPQRERAAAAGAAALAVLLHLLLVAGLVPAVRVGARPAVLEVPEEVVLLGVVEEEPAPLLAPAPARADAGSSERPAGEEKEERRARAPAREEARPEPEGFRTLSPPPPIVLPYIPPPPPAIEITEADFSGIGLEGEPVGGAVGAGGPGGGGEGGMPLTADEIAAAPVFVPRDVDPELKNRREVTRELRRRYPLHLQEAGIGGTVLVWLLIDEEGNVRKYEIKQSSGRKELDRAAIEVIDAMEFSPAKRRDRPVAVWVALPITFRVE
jgi:protein TonB